MVGPWTETRVEELKRLWSEGWSCSRIADQLGNGFTRNAIIGKVTRLDLERRKEPPIYVTGRKPKLATSPLRKRPKLPRPPARPIEDRSIPKEQRCTLMDLTDQTCRWPVGVPNTPDFFFCGALPAEGFPYCAAHCARAYGDQVKIVRRTWRDYRKAA